MVSPVHSQAVHSQALIDLSLCAMTAATTTMYPHNKVLIAKLSNVL
jgi:hypothetical protein